MSVARTSVRAPAANIVDYQYRTEYPISINYIRDKRSPTPKNEAVSRIMSSNRPRDTKPELLLRKALYHAGHRGYRINYRIKFHTPHSALRSSTVRPDITFASKKLAIFVHGCYWHRITVARVSVART